MSANGGGPRTESALDELLDTLSNPVRREIVRYLENRAAEATASLDEIVDCVEDLMASKSGEDLWKALYQVHLPTLERRGWLKFDTARELVSYHGHDQAEHCCANLAIISKSNCWSWVIGESNESRGGVYSYFFSGDDYLMVPDTRTRGQRAVGCPSEGLENVSVDPVDELRRSLEHVDVGSLEGVHDRLRHLLSTTERVGHQQIEFLLVQQRQWAHDRAVGIRRLHHTRFSSKLFVVSNRVNPGNVEW